MKKFESIHIVFITILFVVFAVAFMKACVPGAKAADNVTNNVCWELAPLCMPGQYPVCLCDSLGTNCHYVCASKY